MAASFWQPAFEFLAYIGVFEILIPFILVFTILFATLQKTQLFGTEKGEPKVRINTLVAFIMSLMFVAAFQLVRAATEIAQWSALMLVFLLFAFLIGSMAGIREWHPTWPKVLVLAIIVGILLTAFAAWEWLPLQTLSTIILPIAAFAAVVGYIFWMTK